MTVTTPQGQEKPTPDHTWPVAVVTLIDRALGSRARFRRLVILLIVLSVTLAAVMLMVHPGLPAGVFFRG